jgi:crossover junction endodeoxyribonuclease RuvC
VLGIDPGLSRCGYGIVARERGNPRALGCGVIRTPPGDSLPDR